MVGTEMIRVMRMTESLLAPVFSVLGYPLQILFGLIDTYVPAWVAVVLDSTAVWRLIVLWLVIDRIF